jgi:hypothetical protein
MSTNEVDVGVVDRVPAIHSADSKSNQNGSMVGDTVPNDTVDANSLRECDITDLQDTGSLEPQRHSTDDEGNDNGLYNSSSLSRRPILGLFARGHGCTSSGDSSQDESMQRTESCRQSLDKLKLEVSEFEVYPLCVLKGTRHLLIVCC